MSRQFKQFKSSSEQGHIRTDPSAFETSQAIYEKNQLVLFNQTVYKNEDTSTSFSSSPLDILPTQMTDLPASYSINFQPKKKYQVGLNSILKYLPKPIAFTITSIFAHVRDTDPESILVSRERVGIPETSDWGWLPLLILMCALGLLSVAYSFTIARDGANELAVFLFPGLLLIFAPSLFRLLSPAPSRFERITLVCIVGISFYLVKIMSSPLYFSMYDEFLHWRTAEDIARSGHLFGKNSLLPVSSYYPGLEIVTNAFSSLSRIDIFHAAILVIGMGRLVMILALFTLFDQIMGSPRMAGIATMVYMANPHFLLFDAQFAYESLALPLTTVVLSIMAPHQAVSVRLSRLASIASLIMFVQTRNKRLNSDLLWITLSAWLILGAISFTHHVTDYILVGILLLWTIIYGFLRLTPLLRSTLTKTVLVGILLSLFSVFRPNNPVVEYISSFMAVALKELGHVLSGSSGAKPLFVSYTGQPTPFWERVLTISSVSIILLFLPFGLLCLWRRYRSNALSCTFGIIAFLYPLSQVFRLTNTGSELVDRAAAFLFLAIASTLAICITQFWPVRLLNRRQSSFITTILSIVFLGGVVLGSGPSLGLLPGTYLAIGDPRSIEPQGIQAATWTHVYLGGNNRVATDRTNQILMGTYGGQDIVSETEDQVDISQFFLSSHLDTNEINILKNADVQYLIIDRRLTKLLPFLGYYYASDESGAFHYKTPIALQDYEKFDKVPQVDKVFDDGNIVIYSVERISNAS